MRIISGSLRGRRLRTAEGEGYRPAMGRTREALFSMLLARGMVFDGAVVLDLFAGSGSLGLEALSRGAGRAIFVELDRAAARCLARNIEELGVRDRAILLEDDVGRALRRSVHDMADLVFIDPPYGRRMLNAVLTGLAGHLAPGAFVTAESEREAAFSAPAEWELTADRLFGRTRVLVWRTPGGEDDEA